MAFKKPDSKPDFDKLELSILAWWKEQQILEKSIAQRDHSQSKTFYDGPITANGEPHYGHMLTFAMKDIMPRYWTMQGYRTERSLGWDCQGLPVEYEVEKKLGFKQKKDIEEFGVAEFNEKCRQSVFNYQAAIIALEERIGRLTNDHEEYATMDAQYIESIWWSLQTLYDRGLLYEGYKVVPYSTRAGTTLSSAEVALGGYEPYVDPAVTIAFELQDHPNTYLLAWTTTPWTLPTNFGLALGKDIEYGQVEVGDKKYILARKLIDNYFPSDSKVLPVETERIIGQSYKPVFKFFERRPNAFKVFWGDHVTLETGTGIVHLAPYGAEDAEIFAQAGIEMIDVLNEQGDFTDKVPNYAGQNYREANENIIKDLTQSGALFHQEDYTHDMPMCWRTKTPLIYKPVNSWYIAMSKLRDQLVSNNEQVNWIPSHMKQGRFGRWLEEIKDWGISRSRYWGTPLPIWKSPSGKVKVIGSFAELQTLSGRQLADPHRPFADEITFELEGEKYTRIPDVLDVWYDSGAMPFARFHYPFDNEELFKSKFPAEYIAEGVDQTRGWFYTLLAISTALFDSPAYKNVVVNGFTLDDLGAKQSKSKGNYEPPQTLISKHGADAIRLNFFSSPISAGEDSTISDRTVKQQIQEYILPLWNIYTYLTTYANIHNWEPKTELAYNKRNAWTDSHPWDHIPFDSIADDLDAWILVLLQNTIGEVTAALDSYSFPRATRSLKQFTDNLSKWYIRRSRDRFANGDEDALNTLYYVLIEFLKLSAPFVPFITEHIYQSLVATQLDNQPESIHLTDFPVVDVNFISNHEQLLPEMELVRAICELGQNIRTTQGIKVRQPLSKLEVVLTDQQLFVSDWMKMLIQAELNVQDVVTVPVLTDIPGFIQAANQDIKVALDTNITPYLAEAGMIREFIRFIQAERKQQGLQPEDKAIVKLQASTTTAGILGANKEKISMAVNASSLEFGAADKAAKQLQLNGETISLSVSKSS